LAQAGRIISAGVGPHEVSSPYPGRPPAVLPAHCDLTGVLQERSGALGQHYAIHYHLRLPDAWNGRLLFQGGGGTDGDLGNAIGDTGGSAPPALARGFAVVSQDSGHDNATNTDPTWGGQTVFGTDSVARRNYGHASLPLVTQAAKAIVARYYGKAAKHSYFFGCSKGGQEGMAAAQRYPSLFDGIVAGAPGFALPRAGLNEVWSVQHFADLARKQTGQPATIASIAATFTPAQFGVVRKAILEACDAADGLADGITADFRRCTSKLVLARLKQKVCAPGQSGDCLTDPQIATLAKVMEGPGDRSGRAMYAPWAWDAGVGSPMWSLWRVGSAQMPAFDVVLGGAAMATVFSTPPVSVAPTPAALLAFQQDLDLSAAERSIYASNTEFPQSAWQDIGMHSSDLRAFFARGGKMMVPHGAADPVFSLLDTLQWWDRVEARFGRQTSDHLKVYPVPGMAHCFGGPAVSDYDLLQPMVDWVERGKTPSILARAGDQTPWPGRTRPLCAWPRIARYRGGDHEKAESFACRQ
jgi:feruloyl esterase